MSSEAVAERVVKLGTQTTTVLSVVAFVIYARHLAMPKPRLGPDNSALFSSETPQWVHDIVHLPDSAWLMAGAGGLLITTLLIAFSTYVLGKKA